MMLNISLSILKIEPIKWLRVWSNHVALCETLLHVGQSGTNDRLVFRSTTTKERTAPTFATEGAMTKRYRPGRHDKTTAFCCFCNVCVFFPLTLQPVILKELKQMEGDFNENQKIELNTVRLITVRFLNKTRADRQHQLIKL